MKNIRAYIGGIIGVIFVVILIVHGRLTDYDEERYNNPPPKHIAEANKLKFENVTEELGLGDVVHHLYFPNDKPIVQKYLPFIGIPAYTAVFDFNKDGYMDLYFLEPDPDKPDRLFLNDRGKGFTEITQKYPVLANKGPMGRNVAVWDDFNNDGLIDFFSAETPCYKLYLQTKEQRFVEAPQPPEYCSVSFAINLLDFNRDGNLDIGVANYLPDSVIEDPRPIYQQLVGRAGIGTKGEPNFIFLGNGKGQFKFFQPQPFIDAQDRTATIGFSYINEDLWPDIFVGNDYTFDEMYLNVKGVNVKNVTDQYIPRHYHGFSGMSADFADINSDGKLDLFVTNGWGPPSATAQNILWERSSASTGFSDAARHLEVDKCGWAWGAKFGDYDLDGDIDLFVTNGRSRGNKAQSFEQSMSANYMRTQVRSIPTFLREDVFSVGDEIVPNLAESRFQLYGFERNCLYTQEDGQFYDVAEISGVDDTENGRSIGLIDIENDGKLDLVIGNVDAPIIIYRNVTETDDNWVGFSLLNKNGMPYHGAIVRGLRSDGVKLIHEAFVGNGGRGLSDPRVHFGLGPHEIENNQVLVTWPNGITELFDNIRINKYNKVQYGTGKTVL
jgi:hypothetical protein